MTCCTLAVITFSPPSTEPCIYCRKLSFCSLFIREPLRNVELVQTADLTYPPNNLSQTVFSHAGNKCSMEILLWLC